MSNDDKRRRRDGSTDRLSVADLLARREAETQPIPRITEDEDTVRFSAVKFAAEASRSGAAGPNLSGRELHITELLRREGRAGEEERGGGFSVPKLVAMASGGVVLAGSVAFAATNLMSSPDERPLAEVRFDARPAARATNTLTKDLAAAAAKQQQVQQTEATTSTPEQTAEQRAQQATQQQTSTTQAQAQAPTQAQAQAQAPTSSTRQTTTAPTSTTTTTTAPTSSSTPQPSSASTAPSTSTTPPPSTEPSKGVEIGIDLGGVLDPIGGFDFFEPAN